LDFLGFPWILSSESKLFNGLRGFFAGRKFLAPFPGVERTPGRKHAIFGHAEAQDRSWGKLTLISDFLQEIVARAAPFDRLNPAAPRLSSDFSGRPALLASRYGRGISGFDTPLN
jgi:hypothetical protein